MKVRIVFKDGNVQVYDRASIDWDKRVIEFFDDEDEMDGFVPFEAILVVTKSIM